MKFFKIYFNTSQGIIRPNTDTREQSVLPRNEAATLRIRSTHVILRVFPIFGLLKKPWVLIFKVYKIRVCKNTDIGYIYDPLSAYLCCNYVSLYLTFIDITLLYDNTKNTKVRPVLRVMYKYSTSVNARGTAHFQFAILVHSSVYTFLKKQKTAVEINDNWRR
jgi:hypothetical protein